MANWVNLLAFWGCGEAAAGFQAHGSLRSSDRHCDKPCLLQATSGRRRAKVQAAEAEVEKGVACRCSSNRLARRGHPRQPVLCTTVHYTVHQGRRSRGVAAAVGGLLASQPFCDVCHAPCITGPGYSRRPGFTVCTLHAECCQQLPFAQRPLTLCQSVCGSRARVPHELVESAALPRSICDTSLAHG